MMFPNYEFHVHMAACPVIDRAALFEECE